MPSSRLRVCVAASLALVFFLATGVFSVAAARVIAHVESASGTPSESVPVHVVIDAGGEDVFAMQLDLVFDALAPIAATPDMKPECEINPAIDRPGSVFAFRPRGCVPGLGCTAVRALILAFGSPDPIPNGSNLLTCSIRIDDDAPPGAYPVSSSNCAASSQTGIALAVSCRDGDLTIVEPTPPSVQRLFLATPLSGTQGNTLAFRARGYFPPTSAIEQDPRCPPDDSRTTQAGATLRVYGTGGDFQIDLPCDGWSLNSTGTRYTYRDPSAASCNLVTLKEGHLERVVCRGSQVAYELGDPQESVNLAFTVGEGGSASGTCASFASDSTVLRDGSDGQSYLARESSAPDPCPE